MQVCVCVRAPVITFISLHSCSHFCILCFLFPLPCLSQIYQQDGRKDTHLRELAALSSELECVVGEKEREREEEESDRGREATFFGLQGAHISHRSPYRSVLLVEFTNTSVSLLCNTLTQRRTHTSFSQEQVYRLQEACLTRECDSELNCWAEQALLVDILCV